MTVLVKRKERSPIHAGAWKVRVLVAVCLFFGAEVVLWTDMSRPLWMWLPVGLGYVAAGALIVDSLVRFRVFDLFSLLTLAGVFAVIGGIILNPGTALANLPITLVSRVMGEQVMAGVIGLVMVMGLRRGWGDLGVAVGAALAVGVFWGVWAKGFAVEGVDTDRLPLAGLVSVGAVSAVVVLVVARWQPREIDSAMLRLSRVELGAVIGVLVALMILGGVMGTITREAIGYGGILVTLLGLMLWFQTPTKAVPLVIDTPPTGAPVRRLGVEMGLVAAFVVAGGGAYLIPAPQPDTISLTAIFAALLGTMGLIWLPGVCLVVGIRAYRQQVRTGGL